MPRAEWQSGGCGFYSFEDVDDHTVIDADSNIGFSHAASNHRLLHCCITVAAAFNLVSLPK